MPKRKKSSTTTTAKPTSATLVSSSGSWCDRISIHEAAAKGYEDCVKKKLEKGEDPNARDEMGATPLHYAAWYGDYHIAKLLLDHGADPNARDKVGKTPLHFAVSRGAVEVEHLLLERGANPNAQDGLGNTPLHEAAAATYFGDVQELMFEAAPKLFGIEEFPYERRDVVLLLLKYGADPTIENSAGMTPLELAVKMENDEAAELIAARTPPEYKKRLMKRRNETYA